MTGSDTENSAHPVIEELISEQKIAARVDEIAAAIAAEMTDDLLAVVVLKGSFVFAADLIRALDRAGAAAQVDFMTLSSYGAATSSSGTVQLSRDIVDDVTGRSVLLIDDILESGRTMAYARELMIERGAADVRTCVLLDKPEKRAIELEGDYVGFPIGDRFVVGYGLDLAHMFRGLPYIGVVTSQE